MCKSCPLTLEHAHTYTEMLNKKGDMSQIQINYLFSKCWAILKCQDPFSLPSMNKPSPHRTIIYSMSNVGECYREKH